MTDDIINIVQTLGFPVAVAIGSMLMLAWVVKYILKDKIQDVLVRFDEKHENLQKRFDSVDKKIDNFEREMEDELGKVMKWLAEIKSELKVYIDLTMKGK